MCRLLGYVSQRPTAARDALGASSFQEFTSLTAVHADGWGMAWRDRVTGRTRSASSPVSAATDPRYAELAREPLGPAGMVHLRWATDGLAVEASNTHPFIDGDHAMAHNGSISPIPDLDSLLSQQSRRRVGGDTDSERYFRFVRQCVEEEGEERAGVRRAVGVLHSMFPGASLNALLLTSTWLFAVHVNSAAPSPQQDLRDLFGSDEAMPTGHATAYFDMAYRRSSSAVHVVSSGLAESGWTPIPPDCVLSIELSSRRIEVLDLVGTSSR